MPKIIDTLTEELPELPVLNNDKPVKQTDNNGMSIYDLVKKQTSSKKEQVGVTLSKDIVDKLKTVSVENNITLSKLFEDLLNPLVEDVVINHQYVEQYNSKNKAKGRRVKK